MALFETLKSFEFPIKINVSRFGNVDFFFEDFLKYLKVMASILS